MPTQRNFKRALKCAACGELIASANTIISDSGTHENVCDECHAAVLAQRRLAPLGTRGAAHQRHSAIMGKLTGLSHSELEFLYHLLGDGQLK